MASAEEVGEIKARAALLVRIQRWLVQEAARAAQ
jgi:hypothetical protein